MGHDVGGWVAYALAHEHPDTVEKLVILDNPVDMMKRLVLSDVVGG